MEGTRQNAWATESLSDREASRSLRGALRVRVQRERVIFTGGGKCQVQWSASFCRISAFVCFTLMVIQSVGAVVRHWRCQMRIVALSSKLPGAVCERRLCLFHLDIAKVRNILPFCNSLSLLCASIVPTFFIGASCGIILMAIHKSHKSHWSLWSLYSDMCFFQISKKHRVLYSNYIIL